MAGQLTSIAEEAAKTRSLNGAWKLRALLKVFRELEVRDRAVEGRKSRAKRIMIGGYVLLFVALALTFMVCLVMEFWEFAIPLLLIAAAGFGVARWGTRQRDEARGVDLADELRRTIMPLLEKVAGDVDPQKKVRVNLDLRAMNLNRADRELPPQGSGGRSGTRTKSIYFEPLGSLQLPLANGSTMVVRFRNQFQLTVKRYQSSSGKSKRKEKWKKSSKVTAKLIPAKPTPRWDAYAMRAFADPVRASLKFKAVNGVTTVSIAQRAKFAGVVPPVEVVSSQDVIAMLVRLTAMAHKGIQGAEYGR